MEKYREIETCPSCNRVLEHFNLKGKNVFGCRRCKKEISKNEALIINEVYCPFCKVYYDVNEKHGCLNIKNDLL